MCVLHALFKLDEARPKHHAKILECAVVNENCEELHNFSVSLLNITCSKNNNNNNKKKLPQLAALTSLFYLFVHGLWQTTEWEHHCVVWHMSKNILRKLKY